MHNFFILLIKHFLLLLERCKKGKINIKYSLYFVEIVILDISGATFSLFKVVWHKFGSKFTQNFKDNILTRYFFKVYFWYMRKNKIIMRLILDSLNYIRMKRNIIYLIQLLHIYEFDTLRWTAQTRKSGLYSVDVHLGYLY